MKDRTVQDGDVYVVVCGAKEPRGRVHVLGLGPTPQEIGTLGLKALMSTRMQMEILARQKAESRNRTLEQHVMELEEERITQGRTNVEVLSLHGSNSRQYAVKNPNWIIYLHVLVCTYISLVAANKYYCSDSSVESDT